MAVAGNVFEDLGSARFGQEAASVRGESHALLLQHLGLRSHAELLERVLRSLASTRSQATRGLVLLDDFRSRLGAHLVAEERDGLLESAEAEEPRFARRIEQLRREHGELQARLDRLIDQARIEDPATIHSRFAALRRLLLAHEQAENEVVQRACLDDLGVGD